MRPPAYVVHRLPHRTRLRIPDLNGSVERCDRVAEGLSHCPGIVAARANPVTASVLIEHEDEGLDVIARYGRDLDLFELNENPAAGEPPPAAILQRGVMGLDRWIRSQTHDRTSLNSVAVAAFLAGAVWQVARGQLLPTATQLIWYALSMPPERAEPLSGRRERSAEPDDEEVPTEVK